MQAMRMLAALGVALGLAGCDQVVETARQEAASEVDARTRAAVGEVSRQLDEALRGLDASAVAAEVKQQGRVLKDKARQLVGPDWQVLEQYVGRYPRDIGLFAEVSPIMPELKRVLGNRLAVFRTHMGTQGRIGMEQVLYVTGNKPHRGGQDAAYLLIDTRERRLEVGLLEQGKLTVYASPGRPLPKPKDVQSFITNLNSV
ncbi:hypothetical protein N8I74_12660 [Chitiniphilus purpureus]|uniref:Lipoprotein n=1 Tax=Chitiniphilus purpureus TaxID=2981137 RepID=A0ABY6DIJ8_9NEIS|nr:hypothetical protein [Chitiniphilus sp. CD1]UXY14169.1 hypothetical protein N8I74_12660 [Chitiniphilus sp. CD1]